MEHLDGLPHVVEVSVLLTVRKVAECLRVPTATVYALCERGELTEAAGGLGLSSSNIARRAVTRV